MKRTPAAAVIVQRLMTPAEVPDYLRADAAWFAQARPRLEARGFPRPIEELGGIYDRCAIDAWIDAMSALAREFGDEDDADEDD